MSKRVAVLSIVLLLLVLVLSLAGCSSGSAPVDNAPTAIQPAPTRASKPAVVPAQTDGKPAANLPTGTQPGSLALDFYVQDIDGQEVRLSDFRGQPVAVIFWTSWCPYCKKEMPLLQTLYEEYGERDLVVLGIDVVGMNGERPDKAMDFVDRNQISFPIVFDMNGEVFRTYRGRGVPTLVLVDRQGVVAANIPGAVGRDDLEPLIQHLVEIE